MVTREQDWAVNTPFGICPACGAGALEAVGCEESQETLLKCSDPNCFTLFTDPTPDNPRETMWIAPNPLERRIRWILRNHLSPEDDESCC